MFRSFFAPRIAAAADADAADDATATTTSTNTTATPEEKQEKENGALSPTGIQQDKDRAVQGHIQKMDSLIRYRTSCRELSKSLRHQPIFLRLKTPARP